MVVPISYVDSQSTIHGINIDLNAAPETDVVGVDIYHSNDPFDHEVDSDSDLDVDEVLDDIDDKGVNEDGNIILLTVAQDGNRNVLPIAFAIIDKENMESWKFFLTNLQRKCHRPPNLDDKNYPQSVVLALALVHDADLERVSQFMSYAERLPSTAQ
ncbi:hypothetical protein PVK06_030472 [Gossypium arboreum]|uniref:MULE transposase domain-containing protein n=1 Tax=Gossypium arboreum TaxID=29729 RepID=A0ABR0NNF3_GOSAR|nr:hypothetical protein PVK06_030472 [Gossypium arboreum]